MEQIRSFIAIELTEELKVKLGQLEAQLKSGQQLRVKWVDPEAIHLTLKFLGNIAAGRTGEIARAMEEAAQGVPPFHLEVKGLGAFPSLKRVQVVWVGVGGEVEKLCELQRRIESNLARLGFAPESRPFTGHLTLGRVRDQATPDERERLGQLIAGTAFEIDCALPVGAVSLMRSQLTRQGAIYSRISLVSLKGSRQ